MALVAWLLRLVCLCVSYGMGCKRCEYWRCSAMTDLDLSRRHSRRHRDDQPLLPSVHNQDRHL